LNGSIILKADRVSGTRLESGGKTKLLTSDICVDDPKVPQKPLTRFIEITDCFAIYSSLHLLPQNVDRVINVIKCKGRSQFQHFLRACIAPQNSRFFNDFARGIRLRTQP